MAQKNPQTNKIEYVSKEIVSFTNFATNISKSPNWYVAYNNVKHNREDNLEQANLQNCINAVAGILVLLYSQFGTQCIETYRINRIHWTMGDDYDHYFDADVIFTIQPPKIGDWPDDKLYDFDWAAIKDTSEPFDKFQFT